MRKYLAVLLAVLIIGTTPAFAAQYGEITAESMAVKGKGTAESVVQILENGSTGTEEKNTVATDPIENNTSVASENDSDAEVQLLDPVTSANRQATGADVQLLDDGLDSVASANEDTQDLNDSLENDTVAIPQIDTTGIVMQSSDFSCGPAALATVLQNMGFNSTEQELKVLAGTDTSGTSMHGLSEAAKAKGLSATGMKLSVDDLKPNNIVHIILDGEGHYSVVREITNESVKLADPSLGNIELSREKFSEIYTGNSLVVSDPNVQAQETNNSTQATGTPEQLSNGADTNLSNGNINSSESVNNETDTNSTSKPVDSSATLTKDEMQNIKGRWIGPAGGILGFIVNVAWRRVTKGKYGAADVLLWMSELICGKDFDNDGWIGVPPEARRAGVNGSGYRAKSRRR